MAVVSKAPGLFELKSASMTLVVVVLKTADLARLSAELDKRFGATPDMFNQEPVVIDVAQAGAADVAINFSALASLLRHYKLVPVAVRGASPEQLDAARDAGLGEAPEASAPVVSARAEPAAAAPPAAVASSPAEAEVQVQAAPDTAAAAAPAAVPTLVIDKPLRSGQQVYAKGGDLVMLAAVNFGAEVIADGNIHVYAPLRGKAIAGAKGNTDARIFSTCMEPELVAIAGTYRTTETPLPADVIGQAAQIRLDGERMVFEPLG